MLRGPSPVCCPIGIPPHPCPRRDRSTATRKRRGHGRRGRDARHPWRLPCGPPAAFVRCSCTHVALARSSTGRSQMPPRAVRVGSCGLAHHAFATQARPEASCLGRSHWRDRPLDDRKRRHALCAWALAGSRITRSPRKPSPRPPASGVMRAIPGAYPAGRLRRSCVAPARTSHWRDSPLDDRKCRHALCAWALAGSRITRSPRKPGPRPPASGVRTGAIVHWTIANASAHPPPMAWTISTWSPSWRVWLACSGRGTMRRFTSTATRRCAWPVDSSNCATLQRSAQVCGWPLSIRFMPLF